MNENKPWYLSRTIWASLVTVGLAVAGMAGIAVDDADGSGLADTLVQGATAIAGLVAILGRLRARGRIV